MSLKNIALSLGLVVLAGCSFDSSSPSGILPGATSQAGTGSGAAVSSTGATGKAELAWQIPTENTNGTPLTDLSGYTIVYGTSAGLLDHSVQLTDIESTSYVVTGLGAGTWYFAILSNTSSGTSSALSDVASTTIT